MSVIEMDSAVHVVRFDLGCSPRPSLASAESSQDLTLFGVVLQVEALQLNKLVETESAQGLSLA